MLTPVVGTTNNRILLSSVVVGATLAASLSGRFDLSANDLAVLTTVMLVLNFPWQHAPAATTPTKPLCDTDWKAYDGHCYIRNAGPLSFADASANCQQVGAYWITQNLLKDFSCADPYQCGSWTGGNDIDKENTFVWKSSNKPFTFTNWYGSNPDDDQTSENLDCVEIFYLGSWNDRPCPDLKPFICEK